MSVGPVSLALAMYVLLPLDDLAGVVGGIQKLPGKLLGEVDGALLVVGRF